MMRSAQYSCARTNILFLIVVVCFSCCNGANRIDMDDQMLPECILPGLNNAFGLAFHMCNAACSFCTFSKRKQLNAFGHRQKMPSDFGFFRTGPLSLTQKSAIKRVFYCGFGRNKLRECILPALQNASGHVASDFIGPSSGILRNGDYGSKRVQILYIDVL